MQCFSSMGLDTFVCPLTKKYFLFSLACVAPVHTYFFLCLCVLRTCEAALSFQKTGYTFSNGRLSIIVGSLQMDSLVGSANKIARGVASHFFPLSPFKKTVSLDNSVKMSYSCFLLSPGLMA